jgi:hypothetical protein
MKTKRLLEIIVVQLAAQRHNAKDQIELAIIDDLKREVEQREQQLEAMT